MRPLIKGGLLKLTTPANQQAKIKKTTLTDKSLA